MGSVDLAGQPGMAFAAPPLNGQAPRLRRDKALAVAVERLKRGLGDGLSSQNGGRTWEGVNATPLNS